MRFFLTPLGRAALVVGASLLLHGCGEKSSPSATQPPPPEPPPPGALGAFAAVPGDDRVTLHWRLPTDGSVDETIIRRKVGSAPTSPSDGQAVYEGGDTTTVDTSVENGTTYTYAAWARSGSGDLNGPVTVNARPMPPPPAAPGALTATPGAGLVTITWENPDSPYFDQVQVRVKTGSYPTGPTDGTLVYEGSGTSAVAINLDPEQTVYVSVWAFDDFGQISPPARTTATPGAEILDLELLAWSESHLFPDHVAGDRDFADRGPQVTARLHYEVEGSDIVAVLDYRAEELPGGDGTTATRTFRWVRATVPAGWTFDSWRDDVDQTVSYVDGTSEDDANDRDRFPAQGSFEPSLPIEVIEFLSATKGSDVGGVTNDDTQIWQLKARARTFRVKR